MSTRININENLEINNINEETFELASVIKPYIEQINGMIELGDLSIFKLYLSADDECVEVRSIECCEPDNGFVVGDGFAGQRQVTHSVISKDHELYKLLDKLPEAKTIRLSIGYNILHDAYINEYGAAFFDLHLRNMHKQLSPYVAYKCCTLYEECEYDDNINIYRFDETYNGEVPFARGVLNDGAERNWSICNFVFSVGIESEAKKNKAEEILRESFAIYGFDDICSDDDCVWLEANYHLRDYRISDFIDSINKAKENISCIDPEADAFLSAFSIDDDDYIAVKIHTENGEIVTDWCC